MSSQSEDRTPEETRKERVDRELTELLNGLRVLLPGVQVLLAFLLTVPFSARFAEVTDFQVKVFYVTLVSAALAAAMLGTRAGRTAGGQPALSRSRSTCWLASFPGPPMTHPPGCVPDPHW